MSTFDGTGEHAEVSAITRNTMNERNKIFANFPLKTQYFSMELLMMLTIKSKAQNNLCFSIEWNSLSRLMCCLMEMQNPCGKSSVLTRRISHMKRYGELKLLKLNNLSWLD